MSYQRCPICNGVGVVSGGYFGRAGDCGSWTSGGTTELCQLCNGTGIIDEVTGRPPKDSYPKTKVVEDD